MPEAKQIPQSIAEARIAGGARATNMRGMIRRVRLNRAAEANCAECTGAGACWPDETTRIAARVQRQPGLAAGTVLWLQGDPAGDPVVVRSGCLKVIRAEADGGARIVGFGLPGDLVGLDGLFATRQPTTTVVVAPALVCRVRWQSLGAAQRAHLQGPLLRRAVGLLQAANTRATNADPQRAVQQFLRQVASRIGHRADGGATVSLVLPMSRAEIGQYLGMAEETVCRVLKRLAVNGAVRVRNRRIDLPWVA